MNIGQENPCPHRPFADLRSEDQEDFVKPGAALPGRLQEMWKISHVGYQIIDGSSDSRRPLSDFRPAGLEIDVNRVDFISTEAHCPNAFGMWTESGRNADIH